MRIKIIGDNDCARATRTLLRQAGFAVTEFLPADAVLHAPQAGYVLTIETQSHARPEITLDSADCALEAAVLRHIAQLSKLPVIVDRPGGVVHSDRELRILAPDENPEQATAVEYGILRGLLDLAGPKLRSGDPYAQPQPPATPAAKSGWLAKLLPAIFFTAVAAIPPAFVAAGVALLALSFPRAIYAAPAPAPVPAPALTRSAASGMVSLHGRDAENNLLALAISPSALYPQLQQGSSQLNLALIGGAAVSSALYDSANTALLVHCVVGCPTNSDAADGTTGSAVPTKAIFVAGKNSAGNLTGLYVDPCQQAARSTANINLTASGQIIAGANYTFVCSIFLVTATAQNIAIVEGTGTTCATSTAGLAGGATAATGQNWAANGGFAEGTGQSWIMKTATTGDNICLLLSGTGQTSGNITYVQLSAAN